MSVLRYGAKERNAIELTCEREKGLHQKERIEWQKTIFTFRLRIE